MNPSDRIHGCTLKEWYKRVPCLDDLVAGIPQLWGNPQRQPTASALAGLAKRGITHRRIADAAARLERFRPYIAAAFPETAPENGMIESEIVVIPRMQQLLAARQGITIPGKMVLKCDSHLPISGSIKARGGIYEVLKLAETIARQNDLLTPGDDYACLHSPRARKLFENYRIGVGSTGNLGLSIGIVGARLGFRVTVHMSADARTWKKTLLRRHGVTVVEHPGDYSSAVASGREQANHDPRCHFVDDEASTDLFYGYAVAALRLPDQLQHAGITIDNQHPLFVYLPCGVGGGPGGIAFGLKHVFGDAVHCYFVEPTRAPCLLLGLATGLHDEAALDDFGIAMHTEADGLAVARPSGFVCKAVNQLLDGIVTVRDETLFRDLALLKQSENIDMEPSALACMTGPLWLASRSPATATHLVWGTGGAMVPRDEQDLYYQRGVALLQGAA